MFSGKKKEEFLQKEFEGVKQLELFCDAGNISVHTWKQPNIILEIKKQGNAQQLQNCFINCMQHESLLQVETTTQESRYIANTHMNIIVPEHTDIKVATKQGNISIKNLSGIVHAQTDYGNIEVIDSTNNITALTEHGNITIQRESMGKDHTISATTNNHGSIILQVPQHINTYIEAHSQHGKITSDLLVTLQEQTTKLNDEIYRQQRRNAQGTISKNKADSAQGSIKLQSKFGPIKIKSYV